jgi:hypothetical protein
MRFFRRLRARHVCKKKGHGRLVRVVDQYHALPEMNYLTAVPMVIDRQHYECARCGKHIRPAGVQ